MLRKPAVSGQFYPEDSQALKDLLEQFNPKEKAKVSAKAVILPHAGYVYSGKVAVSTVSRILPKKRLIMLGPNHTGLGKDFSLWSRGEWEIPFGKIKIDEELADRILNAGNCIQEDESAHRHEHSLEVQLPIFYHFFGSFSFVPITCQVLNLKAYRQAAAQIIEGVKANNEEILFVASTDMTHYEPESSARAKDRLAISAILNLDEEKLLKEVEKNQISMCGIAPVAILLSCLKKISCRKAQVSLYQTSGDASGDYNSVVGYVGIIIK